jgi:hypothetical protein
MGVQLSGQVPGEKANGLAVLEADLVADETKRITAVVTFDVSKIVHNVVKGDTYPVVRVSYIEPLEGEAAEAAQRLAQGAYQARTGENELDFSNLDGVDADEDDQ